MPLLTESDKESVFGNSFSTDIQILEEVFNQDFVKALKENHIPLFVASHLSSLGNADLEEDISDELRRVVFSVIEYLQSTVGINYTSKHIIMNSLFSGLYLSDNNGINTYSIGHVSEVRFGSVPYYTYGYPFDVNILSYVLLKPKYSHLANIFNGAEIIMKFLRKYIQSNSKELDYENRFIEETRERMREEYNVDRDNFLEYVMSDLSEMDGGKSNVDIEELRLRLRNTDMGKITVAEKVELLGGRDKYIDSIEKYLVFTCFSDLTIDELFGRLALIFNTYESLNQADK